MLTTETKKYIAFHRFGQAKFLDSGSILGSSQFSDADAQFKSGQNRLKNKQLALLIYIRDTLCIMCVKDFCLHNQKY